MALDFQPKKQNDLGFKPITPAQKLGFSASQQTQEPEKKDGFFKTYIAPSTTEFSRQIQATGVANTSQNLLDQQEKALKDWIEGRKKGDSPRAQKARLDEINRIKQQLGKTSGTLDKTALQQVGTGLGVGLELSAVGEVPALLKGGLTAGFRGVKSLLGFGGKEAAEQATTRAPSFLSRTGSALETPIAQVGGSRSSALTRALGRADDLTSIKPLSQAERSAAQTAPVSTKLGMIGRDTAKLATEGATYGYGFDVSENLKSGDTGLSALTPGLGTLTGAAIPLGIGALRTGALPLSSMVRSARSLANPSDELIRQEQSRLKAAYDDVFNQRETTRARDEFLKSQGKDPSATLSKYGLVPDLEYSNGKTTIRTKGEGQAVSQVDDLIEKRAQGIQESLERIDASGANTRKVLSDLEAQAQREAKRSVSGLELKSKQNKIKSEFDSLRSKYGDEITASQMNTERIAANKNTKSFKRQDFEQDAFNIIGNVFRKNIDEVVGNEGVRAVNAEIGDLIAARDMLRKLDGKGIGSGRFTNIIGSAAASLLGAMAGGGNVVGQIASSIAAMIGFKAFLRALASGQFGGGATRRILTHLQDNPKLLNELIANEPKAIRDSLRRQFQKESEEILAQASEESQNLLPPAGGGARVQQESSGVIPLGSRTQSTIDSSELSGLSQNPRSTQTPTDKQSTKQITNTGTTINSVIPQSKNTASGGVDKKGIGGLIQRIKETPNKEGGFIRVGGGAKPEPQLPKRQGVSSANNSIPKSVNPSALAKKLDAEDITLIQSWIDNPKDLDAYTKLEPILEGMKISKLNASTQERVLADVIDAYKETGKKVNVKSKQDKYAKLRAELRDGEILVRDRKGNIGGIDPDDFDATIYEKI